MQIKTGKPTKKAPQGRKLLYPFDKLEAGQYLEVNKEETNITSAIQAAYQYANRNKVKFKIQRTETGANIYRLA